jgi:hypothetical protein
MNSMGREFFVPAGTLIVVNLLRRNTDSVITCVNKNDPHWHNSWAALSLFVGAKGVVVVILK